MGEVEHVGIHAYQAVIITAAAEEQQVAQLVAILRDATVIEHLAQAAVGHRVLSATGELVEDLLVVQHEHPEVVIFLVERCHAAGLFQIGARSQNNHVRHRLAVDILIIHLALEDRIGIGSRLAKGDKLLAS